VARRHCDRGLTLQAMPNYRSVVGFCIGGQGRSSRAFSTADVMTVEELKARVQRAMPARRLSRGMLGPTVA
jgi:hypothetical protein